MKVAQWTLGLAAGGVISWDTLRPTNTLTTELPGDLLRLKQRIESEWPKAEVKVDVPADPEDGIWYIDLTIGKRAHVVSFKKGESLGFASDMTLKDLGYGDVCLETFESVEALLLHLAHL
ncbi:MAG: hypothetical protein RLZZ347_390 [Candidatus Parcubacteria bacterium]|jgi:hypothetical protein